LTRNAHETKLAGAGALIKDGKCSESPPLDGLADP
jgi:hypothetical protein